MTKTNIKLWAGLGAFALAAGGGLSGAAASDQPVQISDLPAFVQLADASGEGGEGGEGGGAELSDSGPYAYRLLLLEARLRAGAESFAAGDSDAALAHFRSVVAALKGELGEELKDEGFELEHVLGEAGSLPQAIEKNWGEEAVDDSYAHMLHELDEHMLGVNAEERRDPDFVMDLVSSLLHKAAETYEEAISGGAVSDTGKYQDARALVLVARDVLGGAASELSARDADRFTRALAAYGDIQQAFPSLTPPAEPLPASDVLSRVSRLELVLSGLKRTDTDAGEGGEGGENG